MSSPDYFGKLFTVVIVGRIVRIVYQAINAPHNHCEIVLSSVVAHNLALFY